MIRLAEAVEGTMAVVPVSLEGRCGLSSTREEAAEVELKQSTDATAEAEL